MDEQPLTLKVSSNFKKFLGYLTNIIIIKGSADSPSNWL